MSYDYLVFIGRFQPWHSGHQRVAKRALELSHNLILVLGSHDTARSIRNPLTTPERIDIISSCFTPEELERIHFIPVEDYTYNLEKWIASVQGGVHSVVHRHFVAGPIKIGLIGHEKDHTSFYLRLFPQWTNVNVPADEMINATDMRNVIFGTDDIPSKGIVNPDHYDIMISYLDSPDMDIVRDEYWFVKKYKQQFEELPYPPIFVTVDAIVVQSGHVIMVERGAFPGKGQLALPGGFLNQTETIQDAVIRELREETRLKVPEPVLRGSIKRQHVFDDPYRSQRGRTITHAIFFELAAQDTLPKIKGSDDAKNASWIPLNDLHALRNNIFEDHYCIIDYMVGL